VVLLPQEKNRIEDMSAYLWTNADGTGHFALRTAPPGDYRAYAWREIDTIHNVYMDAAFLAFVKTTGVALKLGEGDSANIKIPLAAERWRRMAHEGRLPTPRFELATGGGKTISYLHEDHRLIQGPDRPSGGVSANGSR